MMGKRRQTLVVPGRYESVQLVCTFVTEGATTAGFNEDTIFQIQLATDEACTNVIEHAYGGENVGDLHVDWEIHQGQFVIQIHDQGEAFDPDSVPEPSVPPDATPGGDESLKLKVGGLGLYFMRTLMDEVHFEFHENEGNTLTMSKRLPGKDAS